MNALGDYLVKSKKDAEAICEVLERMVTDPKIGGPWALRAIANTFQNVDSSEYAGFSELNAQGIPLLVRIADNALTRLPSEDASDVFYALRILALYNTAAGTDAVLRAARHPLLADDFWWTVVLRAYTIDHPERARLFEQLSDPLPTGFLAVAFLDSANAAHREGVEDRHPFDSPAGLQQLEQWLTDSDQEHFSYAVSATSALQFLRSLESDALLAIAFDHPDVNVQIEAAFAAAKLGRESGIKWLTRTCLDVNHSSRAKDYLKELGYEDAIPAESEADDFKAKAEFAEWLAHPCELGRAPDELEIVDQRVLKWPPSRELRPHWLIKYCVKETTGIEALSTGVGLVGSVTFCFFSFELDRRPPEDAYAIHCYWDMKNRGLIAETDVTEDSTEYKHMLRQGAIDGLSGVKIISIAEMSQELEYPQRLVALAKATRQGESGWLVSDGPRSRWYAASEMPAETTDKTVLMIHLGRTLLEFTKEPDRRAWLQQGV